jgi:micrococcal nuclease
MARVDPARAALSGLAAMVLFMVGGAGLAVRDGMVRAMNTDGKKTCRALDGDTIACDGERIRLIGVDAPEMGPCPEFRACVQGDPLLSKYSLEAALEAGPVQVESFGVDHYGRTLALVWAGETNVACYQLAQAGAVYQPRWDKNERVKLECGL